MLVWTQLHRGREPRALPLVPHRRLTTGTEPRQIAWPFSGRTQVDFLETPTFILHTRLSQPSLFWPCVVFQGSSETTRARIVVASRAVAVTA